MKKVTLLATTAVIVAGYSAHAMAQAIVAVPPSGPSINGQPIVMLLESLAQDVGPYILAAVAAWIGKNVRNNNLKVGLQKAFEGGAKGVYEALVAQGATVTDIPIKNAAIASETNAIIKNYAGTLKLFNVDPDTIHNAIRKELGSLLAVDPNVTVTPPTTTVATPKLITDETSATK